MPNSNALRHHDVHEFVETLYEGDLHAKRVLSLANATLGVLTSASLAVHAIGQGLAHAQGTLSKHGVKQVDRLLSNQGIRVSEFFAQGERRKAAAWVGPGGRARTLRNARVTESQAHPVATVVCVREAGMKEPWCLVASDPKVGARTLINYYAKRWGIETSFRDIKDLRFGMGMAKLRIREPERRDRLLLLTALAIARLSLLGAAGESLGYDRWLKANTVKRRTHSLFRQGLMLYEHIPNWPEERLRPLLERFEAMLLEQRVFRDAFGVI